MNQPELEVKPLAKDIVNDKKQSLVYKSGKFELTDSYLWSVRLDVKHADFLRTIDAYIKKSNFAPLKSQVAGQRLEIGAQVFIASEFESRGKVFPCWAMNEQGGLKIATLLQHYPSADSLVNLLISEFHRLRVENEIVRSNKHNREWLEARRQGIIERHRETDTIKDFVKYATDQGSQSAERYYCNISKMENKALFLVEQKYKNLREILGTNELRIICMADEIVAKALRDGMSQGLHYKEIYKLAKRNVETFAEVRGKTVVPSALAVA